MIVVNGQPPLGNEALVCLLERALGEQTAALVVTQVINLSALGTGANLTTALAQLEFNAGQPVVIIPPDDAEWTLHLAAEVYQRTGAFPIIARTHASGDERDNKQSSTAR